MWERQRYEVELISAIHQTLVKRGLTTEVIRYGLYKEDGFLSLLNRSKSMIFLCQHETQGIAYQQALSCNVPILAWDRGGYWQDPSYYPHKVKFAPVTSVPYWDARCGVKFKEIGEFPDRLAGFWGREGETKFAPRECMRAQLSR